MIDGLAAGLGRLIGIRRLIDDNGGAAIAPDRPQVVGRLPGELDAAIGHGFGMQSGEGSAPIMMRRPGLPKHNLGNAGENCPLAGWFRVTPGRPAAWER